MTTLKSYTFSDHFTFSKRTPHRPHFDDLLIGWTATFRELCASDPRTKFQDPTDIPWEEQERGFEYETSGQFIRWYIEWLIKRFREMKECVQSRVSNQEIPIWRGMVVRRQWVENLRENTHLGIYWSCDPRYARPLVSNNRIGSGAVNVLLHSKVGTDAVNWRETFQQLLNPKLGWQEREIRLYSGTPLPLLSINGVFVDDHPDCLVA